MTPATVKLHQSLIRLAKGMLSAYELWVRESSSNSATQLSHAPGPRAIAASQPQVSDGGGSGSRS